VQRLLFSYCCDFLGLIIYDVVLDSNLYPIAFGVEDDTFVIPVAGGPGLPYHLDTVIGHLPGESVYLFF